MFIIETDRSQYKSMINVDQLNYSINQHMKKIKEYSDCKKIMKFFQLISEYSVKFCGMSFMNNKTMAKQINVSVRSIQRYTKALEQLHVLLKIPTKRKNNRGQTSNTYIILPVLKSVVDRLIDKDCHGVCHAFKPSINPSLKQESNNIHSNPLSENKIVKYVVNRVQDSINKGTTIKYLSSYVDKLVRQLEKQAIYAENEKIKRQMRQREEVADCLAVKLGIKKEEDPLPFYDWLNA